MATSVDELLDFVSGVDVQNLRWQIKKLRGLRDWVIRQTGFAVGDTVIIRPDMPCTGGWACYAEALQGGRATIDTVDFSPSHDRLYADVMLEREWSTSERYDGTTVRYWNGPVAETPDGYEPPSTYDQQTFPDGRRHSFMMWLDDLLPITAVSDEQRAQYRQLDGPVLP